MGQAPILEVHEGLPDFDTRTGRVNPTPQQLAAVSGLGAEARWNRFGTPQSLLKDGDFLATGLSGDAVTATREWIRSNRALFRLSDQAVTNLDLLTDAHMPGSRGRAVIFRQRFGALPAGQDGMIAVGIVDGSIAYVSSSAAKEGAAPGAASLSAVDAWLRAAADAGRAVAAGSVGAVQDQNGWSVFPVTGFSHPQRARLVAFPMPGQGARAAYETVVLDVEGGTATAYKYFIDAGSGAALFRQNAVNQLAETSAFNGSYEDAPAPLACGPLHPFSVPAGTKSIAVSATAAVVTNDIVLKLILNGTTVASSDTLTSPEGIHYAPAVVTPGTYNMQVCPFAGPIVPATPPYNYVGTFTANDVPINFPYPPKWRVFPANPPLDLSSADTRRTWCWESAIAGVPVPGCEAQVKNLAARAPWDHDTRTNAPTFTTKGNADSAASAWASPLTPAEGQRPVSAAREYSFPWTNQWQTSKCSPAVFATPQRNDIDAAAANLFAMHNRMHDWSYFLGFTEDAFNLQDNNFGNTAPGPFPLGREADPELGDAQVGAVTGGQPSLLGRDNANQITLNDGIPPITNMYLWQPIAGAFYSPCVDGDFDMSVIGHEYTHAISNRMVGGPDSNLSSDQGGAMGESWSDLNAVEYLNEYGFVPTGGENPFAVGPYVTGNGQRGIRNYGMNASPLIRDRCLPGSDRATNRRKWTFKDSGVGGRGQSRTHIAGKLISCGIRVHPSINDGA